MILPVARAGAGGSCRSMGRGVRVEVLSLPLGVGTLSLTADLPRLLPLPRSRTISRQRPSDGARGGDLVERAALFIAMNDMMVNDGVVIPVVWHPQVSAIFQEAESDTERLGQHILEPQGLV